MKKTSRNHREYEAGATAADPESSQHFAAAVGRALKRSARTARRIARLHGTPVYIWRDGKVVAEKP